MSRTAKIIFCALLTVALIGGAFVRAWRLGDRPFWQDEAWVALAVTDNSVGQLLSQTDVPLPPLFAIATKLVGQYIPPPEVGFRLLPLLCGIGLLPLMYVIGRTLGAPRMMALAGMVLCAFSLMLVLWSRELKQYELETFLAALLALFVFRVRRNATPRHQWWLYVVIIFLCMLGPWIGYALFFPMLTLTGVLIVLPKDRGSRHGGRIIGVIGLAARDLCRGGSASSRCGTIKPACVSEVLGALVHRRDQPPVLDAGGILRGFHDRGDGLACRSCEPPRTARRCGRGSLATGGHRPVALAAKGPG